MLISIIIEYFNLWEVCIRCIREHMGLFDSTYLSSVTISESNKTTINDPNVFLKGKSTRGPEEKQYSRQSRT